MYLDLLDSDLHNDLLARPSRLKSLIPPNFNDWIIIDEIQKVPSLLNEFHRLIEKYRYKFILTGSSARSLRKKGLETLCFQELKAINAYFELNYDFYYWRTSHGVEVDFVLYGPKGILAFEIKRSNKISNKDLKGLKAFQKDYPEAKCYLLYGGKRAEYVEDISILPVETTLRNLPSILSTF